jgi:hypothetical protein
MHGNGGVGSDILKGAVAGAAATWLMGQATTWMYEHEDAKARRREDEARGDRSAYETAAEKAAGFAGVELSKEQRGQAGLAIHWALGIGAGVVYALLRRRAPAVRAANGLAFGTGFYLVVDEVLNPVLGLTPGPEAFPWQAHARGLGGHLAFGATTELVLEGLDCVG